MHTLLAALNHRIECKQVLVQMMQCVSSVSWSFLLSVSPVYCGKTADWIRMQFGVVDQLGLRMRQVLWVGDCSLFPNCFAISCY